ncbi:MAG TPA: hypothetical protein VF204_19345, partial [Streptosporangiaceae bacterium]
MWPAPRFWGPVCVTRLVHQHQLSPGAIAGAALIRPDGVIGWKPPAGTPTAEAAPQLTPVLAALLS